MGQTLQQLGQLLLQAIPTLLFFIFLTVYLKKVYFEPVGKILEERRRATEGTRALSDKAFAAADEKASEFDRAVRLAYSEISAENEAQRKQWADEEQQRVAKARVDAEYRIEQARKEIAQEIDEAQGEMDAQVEPLSDQILEALRRRRAA